MKIKFSLFWMVVVPVGALLVVAGDTFINWLNKTFLTEITLDDVGLVYLIVCVVVIAKTKSKWSWSD